MDRRTRVPLEEGLVLPDLSASLAQDGRSLAALGQLASRATSLVDHGARDIDALLGEDADIVFVGIRGDGGVVGRGSRGIGWALVGLKVRVVVVHAKMRTLSQQLCLPTDRGTNKLPES